MLFYLLETIKNWPYCAISRLLNLVSQILHLISMNLLLNMQSLQITLLLYQYSSFQIYRYRYRYQSYALSIFSNADKEDRFFLADESHRIAFVEPTAGISVYPASCIILISQSVWKNLRSPFLSLSLSLSLSLFLSLAFPLLDRKDIETIDNIYFTLIYCSARSKSKNCKRYSSISIH